MIQITYTEISLFAAIYVVLILFCFAAGFWLCDRFHPARYRLNEIKLLMRQQNAEVTATSRNNYTTMWVDVFVKVAPYEET